MSNGPRFSCQSCGKSYGWKPEYAGKKVQCVCGTVMVAPAEPPVAKTEPENDLYDLAEEPAPAKKPVKVPVAAAAAPMAPAPAAAAAIPPGDRPKPVSPMIAYQQTMRQRDQEEEKKKHRSDFENQLGGELWRELYVPGAMVVVGLALNVLLFMHSAGGWISPSEIMKPLLLTLAFNLVLSFIGVIIVAKLFEIGFGHPGTALLKLSACVLLPTAIAGFAGNWIGGDSDFVNFMTRATLMFPLTLGCVMLFFQLALDECIWVVCTIYIITDWVTKFLLAVMLTTGAGAELGGAMLGISDQEVAENMPKSKSPEIEKQIKAGETMDAMAWLRQGNRTFGTNNYSTQAAVFTPDQAMQLLQTLKGAGATDLQLADMYTYRAYMLYIGLPKDKAARDKLIATTEQIAENYELELDEILEEDTYLILDFPHGLEKTDQPVGPNGKYQ